MPPQAQNTSSTSCIPQTATRGKRRRNLNNSGDIAQQSKTRTEAGGRHVESGGVRISLEHPHASKPGMLLKYVSEWDPRQGNHARGGYLTGRISGVPNTADSMKLSFVTEAGEALPVLTHIVRKDGNKGSRK